MQEKSFQENVSKQECQKCGSVFEDLSLLYFYKSEYFCKECFEPDKDSMTVLEIVQLFKYQERKIFDNTLMPDGIASDKQLRFIRFIHMYSSSEKLPDTDSWQSIQEFISKYKDEAFYLSDRLKKICILNDKGFPVLVKIFNLDIESRLEANQFARRLFVDWLEKDEKVCNTYYYRNYDEEMDRKNILES